MTNELTDIVNLFPKESDCLFFLEIEIWGGKPVCPYCKKNPNYSISVSKLTDRHHCNACNSSFSVTVKTIFSGTRCDLRKWFLAIYLLHLPTKKITSRYSTSEGGLSSPPYRMAGAWVMADRNVRPPVSRNREVVISDLQSN